MFLTEPRLYFLFYLLCGTAFQFRGNSGHNISAGVKTSVSICLEMKQTDAEIFIYPLSAHRRQKVIQTRPASSALAVASQRCAGAKLCTFPLTCQQKLKLTFHKRLTEQPQRLSIPVEHDTNLNYLR